MKYQELISEYETKMESLEFDSEDILNSAEAKINETEKYIKELRRQVVKRGFSSIQEEILFFKHIKPKIFSKLIYYVKLFDIESKRPRSSSKFQIKYLDNHINKLQVYFNDHSDFYHYHRRGSTALDKQYFIRGKSALRLPTESLLFYIDEKFSTCQDTTVATILAYDKLISYLLVEVGKLTGITHGKTEAKRSFSKLFWTGSKTELIELIYALQGSGRINSGTAEIKELAKLFEHVFKIDLGNYYHTFIEIRARKSSKTKFLDRLNEVMTQRFEDLDE